MKAITCRSYGPPEVLKIEDLPVPGPREHEILIEVHASAVNSADWRLRQPDPAAARLFFGLLRPRNPVPGGVLAGIVKSIGGKVTRLRPGDRVFGSTGLKFGAHAEYACLPESAALAIMPGKLSFRDAAAVPFGGLTALHFLRRAEIKPAQRVLIYGASGSVGTAAVQIAKYYGAEVTAVCSHANLGLVKSLGADHLIDYNASDFSEKRGAYDVVFETVGKTTFSTCIRALKASGVLLLGSASAGQTLRAVWSLATKTRVIAGMTGESAADMEFLAGLLESGSLRAVVDKTYPLEQTAQAHQYAQAGHKKGNVVVEIRSQT